MVRWSIAAVAVILVAASACVVCSTRWSNYVVIRNSSGAQITDVKLVLNSIDGKWSREHEVSNLAAGDEIAIHHTRNDTSAELSFLLAGSTHAHSESYIDLWRGEGWFFDVQFDGHVNSGYDNSYSRSD